MRESVFFDDLDLQIVKIHVLDEGILREAGFVMPFKILDVALQPDRLLQIELHADLVQRAEDLVRPGVRRVAADHGILQHMIVPENLGP